MFRVFTAGIVFFCGVGLSIAQLFQHHWTSGVVYVAGGILSSLLIMLGVLDNYDRPLFVVGFGLVGALGLGAVFVEHRALQPGRSAALAEGMDVFLRLDPSQCSLPPARLHFLHEAGVRACGMQGIADQLDIAQTVQRARLVPPEMTIPDGLLQVSEKEAPDPCIQMLQEVQRACPHVLTDHLNEKLASLRR